MKVNIGLNIGEKEALTPELIKSVLSYYKIGYKGEQIAKSETEKTFVANVEFSGSLKALKNRLHKISALLSQDCVALKYKNGKGALIGPEASKWGKFNSKYFLEPIAIKID